MRVICVVRNRLLSSLKFTRNSFVLFHVSLYFSVIHYGNYETVCLFVCLSVCLSVCPQHTSKTNDSQSFKHGIGIYSKWYAFGVKNVKGQGHRVNKSILHARTAIHRHSLGGVTSRRRGIELWWVLSSSICIQSVVHDPDNGTGWQRQLMRVFTLKSSIVCCNIILLSVKLEAILIK